MMRFAAMTMSMACLWANVFASQRAVTLDDLLDRATTHVDDFVRKLSRVVAEEQYVQEYLVSRPEDRENRLTKLFFESRDTVTAIERGHEIAVASAQFNIKQIGTVDNPMLAIGMLQRVYRERFRFTMRGRDAAAGQDIWVVEFREAARPTNIRISGDRDIVARGRYWIDANGGQVIRSEVVFNSLGSESTITTSFAPDDRLGTHVPVEMRFRRSNSNNEVRGVATYGRVRRFEVGTEESIQK